VSVEPGVVRRAAQLVAPADGLRQEGLGRVDERPSPIWWPSLKAVEVKHEWEDLRRWVGQLRVRFPNAIRLPDCWWRHNDLVEVLAALRDYERACFTPSSPATAAVEWQRALREMEIRMEIWIKRFGCSVPGRGHDPPDQSEDAIPRGWNEFIEQDAQRRGGSPTPLPSEETTTDQ
jgi:hypothetical protein